MIEPNTTTTTTTINSSTNSSNSSRAKRPASKWDDQHDQNNIHDEDSSLSMVALDTHQQVDQDKLVRRVVSSSSSSSLLSSSSSSPTPPIQSSSALSLPFEGPAIKGCRLVDNYEKLNRIDEGSYGIVYRARDRATGEVVALKRLKLENEKNGFPVTTLR